MSVKVGFDAVTGKLDWSVGHPDPYELARYMWQLDTYDEGTLAAACELAAVDRASYDKLFEWAKQATELTPQAKVMLFDALVRDRPKPADRRFRDNHLRLLADILVRDYGLHRTKNEATTGDSAASILARLPGAPSERSIERILRE